MLSGENSILNKAGEAKNITETKSNAEKVQLAYIAARTMGNGTLEKRNLENELGKYFKSYDVDQELSKVTIEGKVYYFDGSDPTDTGGDDEEDSGLPKNTGTKPFKPSASFNLLEGTNFRDGLVITDAEDQTDTSNPGNEYVWIEVPSTAIDSNATGGPDYSRVSGATDYTNIATALRKYCSVDQNENQLIGITGTDDKTTTCGWIDEWYNGCGINSSEEYVTLYNKMLKSVYENGGFWIGRYEAGALDDDKELEEIVPFSKIDQFPIGRVKCKEAQMVASKLDNIGSYNSSLMFGIQWDLVIKHLNNKGVDKSLLTENSESWGNYDLTYELNQTSPHGYKWMIQDPSWSLIQSGEIHRYANWSTIAPVVYTPGASERNKQKNIYDLAGNLYEWTLEHALTYDDSPCAYRGGSFYASGSVFVAAHRGSYSANSSYAYHRI